MPKIFLISPVRGISKEWLDLCTDTVTHLESVGHSVHWPYRDTNQESNSGLEICEENLAAIQNADWVFIAWDGNSQGCLFDLGMAFALRKKVIPVRLPPKTSGKSFQNMIYDYFDHYDFLTDPRQL